MKPIAVITHVDHEGPGYFATFLDRHKVPFQLISIGRGDAIPKNPTHWSGICSMGGPMSVNDPLPWIADECALIRAAIAEDIPVLGHCLGAQMMAKALGGRVTQNHLREIGWHPVRQVESSATRPWINDLPGEFMAFHWHGETFSIPTGATRLLTNSNCENQAFVIGNSLAFQCHVEMTDELILDWIERSPQEFVNPRDAVQTADEITHDLSRRVHALHQNADFFYSRWLEGVTDKLN